MTTEQIENGLAMFTGTEEYHRWSILFPFVCTDGAKYMADKCGAYWLLDIVGSYQGEKKFKNESFQTWEFKKTGEDSGVVTATDGNKKVLATQEIPFTDFPLDEIKLYFIDNIILLPNEY